MADSQDSSTEMVEVTKGAAALLQLWFGSPNMRHRQAYERLALQEVRCQVMVGHGPGVDEVKAQVSPPGETLHRNSFAPSFGFKLLLAGDMGEDMRPVNLPVMIDSMVEDEPSYWLKGFVAHDFSHNLRRAGATIEPEHLFVMLKYNFRARDGFILLMPELAEQISEFYLRLKELPDEE